MDMNRFLLLQLRIFVACLGRMWRARLTTLFTVSSVGLVLSLPLGLYFLSVNLDSVSRLANSTPEITIFVSDKATDDLVAELTDNTRRLPEVDQVRIISADEALDEFKSITGIETIIKYVPENPLPTVVIVQPLEAYSSPAEIQQLVNTLRNLEWVDAVEFDLAWVRRLHSFIGLVNTIFTLVSILLVFAAVLLICNMTRLSVFSRQDEIIVINQVGGTDAFIRRPFVYIAVMQSLMGVAVATAVVEGIRLILVPRVVQLAQLYSSDFGLTSMSWEIWLTLTVSVGAISWLASRITVRVCLNRLTASKN